MKNSRLKQALYYQLDYFGWSSLYVYGIAIAAMAAIGLLITTSGGNGNASLSIGGVGFVHLLIMGIAEIRSDLKFFLQHGISRRTTFFSHLYGSLICGAALGLFCEFFSLVTSRWLGLAGGGSAFAIQNFLAGWLLHTVTFFFAWQIGALISLIYYRLNKMQQIVFSVTAIAAIIFAFSSGIRFLVRVSDELGDIIQRALENTLDFTGAAIWVILLLGILAAAGNYFLLRRAQVKE